MNSLSLKEIQGFQSAILDFYHLESRSFPWRETRNPYSIMVSEFMLQQTQTNRVLIKYLEWHTRFPTIESLAKASLSDVLSQWVGLGYNRRARFLHESAKLILQDYAGVVPKDPDILDSLPGIGPYTARAISTFAYGIPHTFIETNIRSVFIFFFFSDVPSVDDKEILLLIEQTVYLEDPRTWYYALMDYGSVLKKKIKNPNRKSKHYTKQSKFDGSLRQARGSVIRHLGIYGKDSLESIAIKENLPLKRIIEAAKALQNEGMVAEIEGVYSIF